MSEDSFRTPRLLSGSKPVERVRGFRDSEFHSPPHVGCISGCPTRSGDPRMLSERGRLSYSGSKSSPEIHHPKKYVNCEPSGLMACSPKLGLVVLRDTTCA